MKRHRVRQELRWHWRTTDHILVHMVQFLVQLDDRLAKELDRVVPAKSRKRSEFIRRAVRKALMEVDDRRTAEKYRKAPQAVADDQEVSWLPWDPKPRRSQH